MSGMPRPSYSTKCLWSLLIISHRQLLNSFIRVTDLTTCNCACMNFTSIWLWLRKSDQTCPNWVRFSYCLPVKVLSLITLRWSCWYGEVLIDMIDFSTNWLVPPSCDTDSVMWSVVSSWRSKALQLFGSSEPQQTCHRQWLYTCCGSKPLRMIGLIGTGCRSPSYQSPSQQRQSTEWQHYNALSSSSCCSLSSTLDNIIMVALCNRADHYIFTLWFLSFFFLFFFLAWSQQSAIGCLPYFHTWCGLSANLECMSEMCCTRLAENTGCKNRHFGTIAQLCRVVSLQLRHVSTIGKKLVKHRYLTHMFS